MAKQEAPMKSVQEMRMLGSAQILEKVGKCQKDITSFRSKCDKDIFEIEKKYISTVKPHIKERNSLILQVPQFWSKTLLQHPLLSTIFEPGEKDVIKHMLGLDIEDDPDHPDYFKIHFIFNQNPYFENRVLTKQFTEEGSASSTIKWRTDQKFPENSKHELWEHDDLGVEQKGFFRWFSDPEEQFCDPISDILRSQIWFDPLEYYFLDYISER